MRTQEIDRLRRLARRLYDDGELDRTTLCRVQTLCTNADSADLQCEACHRDNLIDAVIEILWPDEEMS